MDPVSAVGDTLAELVEDMEHYLRALKRPVLAYEDFPNEGAAPVIGDTTPWEEVKAELVAEGAGAGLAIPGPKAGSQGRGCW